MDAGQLAETTMDPRHRTLRRIRIEDAAAAAGIFDLLMGSEVAPRRDFIVARRRRARPLPHRRLTVRGPAGSVSRLLTVPVRLAQGCGPGRRPAGPPSAASGWRTRSPEPSRRPSGGGRSTGVPASVAPRAGPGPAQASTSTSSPLRNRWQRTPPVARPLGGYSA